MTVPFIIIIIITTTTTIMIKVAIRIATATIMQILTSRVPLSQQSKLQ